MLDDRKVPSADHRLHVKSQILVHLLYYKYSACQEAADINRPTSSLRHHVGAKGHVAPAAVLCTASIGHVRNCHCRQRIMHRIIASEPSQIEETDSRRERLSILNTAFRALALGPIIAIRSRGYTSGLLSSIYFQHLEYSAACRHRQHESGESCTRCGIRPAGTVCGK